MGAIKHPLGAIKHPFGNPLNAQLDLINAQLDLIKRIVSSENPGVSVSYSLAYDGDYVELSILKDGKRHEMKFTGTYIASTGAFDVAHQIETTIGLWRQEYPTKPTSKKPTSIETWADKWAEKQ